jgi:hypothetical protein
MRGVGRARDRCGATGNDARTSPVAPMTTCLAAHREQQERLRAEPGQIETGETFARS